MTMSIPTTRVHEIVSELRSQACFSTIMDTNLGSIPISAFPNTYAVEQNRDVRKSIGLVTHTTGRLYYLPYEASNLGLSLPKDLYPDELTTYIAVKCAGTNREKTIGIGGRYVNFLNEEFLEGLGTLQIEDHLVPEYINQQVRENGIKCLALDGREVEWNFITGRLPLISFPISKLHTPHCVLTLEDPNLDIPLGSGLNQLHVSFYLNPIPLTFKDIAEGINIRHSMTEKRDWLIGLTNELIPSLHKLPSLNNAVYTSSIPEIANDANILDIWFEIIKSWVNRSYLDCQLLSHYFTPKMRHLQNVTIAGMTDFEQWLFRPFLKPIYYPTAVKQHFLGESRVTIGFLSQLVGLFKPNQLASFAERVVSIIPANTEFGSYSFWLNGVERALLGKKSDIY
jgi:hypothetical protein